MRARILGVFLLCLAHVHWTAAQTCSNKDRIRLVGGRQASEGRLEVLGASGQWSGVCPDGWTSSNAAVACRQLCSTGRYASSVPAAGPYGRGAPIRIFGTLCKGYEHSLLQCPHSERSRTGNCFEDAGVGLCCHKGCDGRNLFLAPRLRASLRCEYDRYTVTVENAPTSLGGVVYPFDLMPNNDQSCFDTITGQNTTHKWMTVPFTKCGVERDPSDQVWLKYKQMVLIKGQTMGETVTRLYRYLLPVTCGLNRITNETAIIGTGAGNGTGIEVPPLNDTLKLDLSIKVYKNADFTEQYPLPVNVLVGTPLYVKLAVERNKLQGGDDRAKIVVEKCSAFPFRGSPVNLHHQVIDKQTAVDAGTAIDRSPALPEVRFKMENFKIGIQYRELYLSCVVYVCPSNDRSIRCSGPAANGQHAPGATKRLDENAEFAGDTPSAQLVVESAAYGASLPRFRSGMWGPEEVPGLQEGEYLRLGRDGNYYLFKTDGTIRRWRGEAPKP